MYSYQPYGYGSPGPEYNQSYEFPPRYTQWRGMPQDQTLAMQSARVDSSSTFQSPVPESSNWRLSSPTMPLTPSPVFAHPETYHSPLLYQHGYVYRELMPKPRYTPEEDLFIRRARERGIAWGSIAAVLRENYHNGDNRNSKNLQVHYSQKIRPTVSQIEDLSEDDVETLKDTMDRCLDAFYNGVVEEFARINFIALDAGYVMKYTENWSDHIGKELETNLAIAQKKKQKRTSAKTKKKAII